MTTHTLSVSARTPAQRSPLQGLLGPCMRGALFVALVTGLAYPLLTTGVAQLVLPAQAAGSLVRQGDAIVGSQLIGQHFTAAHFFHARPSGTSAPDPQDASKTVSAPYNAGASAASNQGPTNAALIEAVAERARAYRSANGLAAHAAVPVDAVTASGSGLDPHISLANAQLQAPRVAQARGLAPAQVQALVAAHTEGRLLGLWGEPRVNVLALNLALLAQAAPAVAVLAEEAHHAQ
ncbi:K(+)-transporting ATPase subunit C [Oryzisolibacter sp. LB2S]|uniref:K(+)-transporting ATPase subunit C n=1 Tax=Alicycliphilus soli TaxID=3228789 RepID=UPI00345A60AF